MTEHQSLLPWYQAAVNLFKKQQGRTIVASPSVPPASHDGEEHPAKHGKSFWGEFARRVYCLVGAQPDNGRPDLDPAPPPTAT